MEEEEDSTISYDLSKDQSKIKLIKEIVTRKRVLDDYYSKYCPLGLQKLCLVHAQQLCYSFPLNQTQRRMIFGYFEYLFQFTVDFNINSMDFNWCAEDVAVEFLYSFIKEQKECSVRNSIMKILFASYTPEGRTKEMCYHCNIHFKPYLTRVLEEQWYYKLIYVSHPLLDNLIRSDGILITSGEQVVGLRSYSADTQSVDGLVFLSFYKRFRIQWIRMSFNNFGWDREVEI
jgi:hypothetical protein